MSDEKDYSFHTLQLGVEEDIDAWLEDNPDIDDVDEVQDMVFEFADSAVPVYNYDRAMYMAHNLWLGCTPPESCTPDDGIDVFTIIGIVMHEELVNHGYVYAQQQIENRNEEREYQLTEEEA